MMTSRAEYRLLLRQDNADLHLSEKGYEIGLISQERYDWVCKKEQLIEEEIRRCEGVKVGASKEVQALLESYGSIPLNTGTNIAELIRRPELDYEKLAPLDPERPALAQDVIEQVDILIKYDGYIKRQVKQVEQFKKLEKKKLPQNFDYSEINGLRIEAVQKLNKYQPLNIGQASRISGVSPADTSVILVYLEQLKYTNPELFYQLNGDL
jgi:tRNA uridine 5-carboxymethylaminomethyl modification enzyme